jgi:hypothetical protein
MSLGVNDAKFLREEAQMYRELRDAEQDAETREFFDVQAQILEGIADGIDEALGLLEFAMETSDNEDFVKEIVEFID